jgi:hypothetical protein
MKIIRYQGHPIHLDLGSAMVSLTDLWRAAGSPNGLKPSQWRSNIATQRFAEYIRESLKVSGRSTEGNTDVFRTTVGGNNPHTWAHWQMALAYAQDLSPAFRAWCGEVLRHHMEGAEVQVLNKMTSQLLQTPTGLRTLRQLETHLKRLVDRKALSGAQATNILSEVFNLALGLRLPQVPTSSKPSVSIENAEEVEVEETEGAEVLETSGTSDVPGEAVVPPNGGQYVNPGPNEVAGTDPILPPNTYTGNGAADAIDKMHQVSGEGLFACWMNRRGLRSADRNARGREFCRIMRELRLHPGRTQEYEPPPLAVTERYAGIYPTKAVRTITTGEAGHGLRDVVLFHPPAVLVVRAHILREMGLWNGTEEVPPMSGAARSQS